MADRGCAMDGSCDSQYLTAPTTLTEYGTTSSSLFSDPAHSESTMEKTESGDRPSVEEQINRSKCHWSHVGKSGSNITDEEEVADNLEVFKTLQMHPSWGDFFWTSDEFDELVMGEKFAEGGQAELYHAQVKWPRPADNDDDLKRGTEYVLKVFKKGTSLRHLQSQWPQGFLQLYAERAERMKLGKPHPLRYCCRVMCGTLLKDGRFAFLLVKEHEDLRTLIDHRMLRIGQEEGPFTRAFANGIMYHVARGMDWLHSRDIIHRDLKSSNVLYDLNRFGNHEIFVADYECSIGVIGTGFWRAPEILQALKEKNVFKRPELFSKEADIYAYGMACYEILTGKLPFEGHSLQDYDLVLNGQQLELPEYVDGWARDLLRRCWERNPADRPSFGEVLELLAPNSTGVNDAIRSE